MPWCPQRSLLVPNQGSVSVLLAERNGRNGASARVAGRLGADVCAAGAVGRVVQDRLVGVGEGAGFAVCIGGGRVVTRDGVAEDAVGEGPGGVAGCGWVRGFEVLDEGGDEGDGRVEGGGGVGDEVEAGNWG